MINMPLQNINIQALYIINLSTLYQIKSHYSMLKCKQNNSNKLKANDLMININFDINRLQCPYMEKMHTIIIILLILKS